ncbi:MAG: HK97 gp10 family phage protein [Candidatus Bathyarchaeota archaeon]|nr:HK97 gp10 family phage protein [Candidatus Bathyarchaeota archaeon]
MSVSVNLTLSGSEEFQAAVSRFDGAMQRQIQEKLSEWAQTVKSEAERLVPVRTGFLQSSIFARSVGWQIQVGAEAEYAAAVEFGTGNMRAQPYLAPALETHLPSLERYLLEAINSAKAEAQL